MPPWFIDIESATEIEAKSKATPPASRTAATASRANSPRTPLNGGTRPSVEATPTKGLPRSSSRRPSARRKARCGARSSPSTVMREGSFLVFTHDLIDRLTRPQAEIGRALRVSRLGCRVHNRLQARVGLEAHLAPRPGLHRVPHFLRAHADATQQHRAPRAQRFGRHLGHAHERVHDAPNRDAGEPRLRLHRAHIVAPGERLPDRGAPTPRPRRL